jgi:hypothetical protein
MILLSPPPRGRRRASHPPHTFHPHTRIPCHTLRTPAAGCGANIAWQAGGMPFRPGRNVRQGLGGDGGPSAVRWQRCARPGTTPSQPPEKFRVPVPVRRRQPGRGWKRACGGRVLRMRGGRSTPGRSRIVNARQPSVPERGSEAMPGCPCPGCPAGPAHCLSDADTIRRNSGRARGRATVLLHSPEANPACGPPDLINSPRMVPIRVFWHARNMPHLQAIAGRGRWCPLSVNAEHSVAGFGSFMNGVPGLCWMKGVTS